jgi:hypothetical protein
VQLLSASHQARDDESIMLRNGSGIFCKWHIDKEQAVRYGDIRYWCNALTMAFSDKATAAKPLAKVFSAHQSREFLALSVCHQKQTFFDSIGKFC